MTDKKKEAPRRVAFTREYFAWADHIATKAAAAYGKAAKEYALAAGEESVLEHTSPDTLAMNESEGPVIHPNGRNIGTRDLRRSGRLLRRGEKKTSVGLKQRGRIDIGRPYKVD